MTLYETAILFVSGLGAGVMNAVAGGGTFLTFPTLLFIGLPSVPANATSSVGVLPGMMSSTVAYRKLMISQKRTIFVLGGLSILGGTLGGITLLYTPSRVFDHIVPWLLLAATLLFAFGPAVRKQILGKQRQREQIVNTWSDRNEVKPHRLIKPGMCQFLIAIYGGFYGAGAGILQLAVLDTMDFASIHVANGLKVILSSAMNLPAVLVFIFAGLVDWKSAVIIIVATCIGGFAGAHYAQKLREIYVRIFVIVVGTVMTAYLFVR